MKACYTDYYWLLLDFGWMWKYYNCCAGKIMDCLMFLFYALVLCQCLYDEDDTWIFHAGAMTFVDQTLEERDPTRLMTDLHGRLCRLMERFLSGKGEELSLVRIEWSENF